MVVQSIDSRGQRYTNAGILMLSQKKELKSVMAIKQVILSLHFIYTDVQVIESSLESVYLKMIYGSSTHLTLFMV